jgi:hypothetical protein
MSEDFQHRPKTPASKGSEPLMPTDHQTVADYVFLVVAAASKRDPARRKLLYADFYEIQANYSEI